jgi:hypothetical protein
MLIHWLCSNIGITDGRKLNITHDKWVPVSSVTQTQLCYNGLSLQEGKIISSEGETAVTGD